MDLPTRRNRGHCTPRLGARTQILEDPAVLEDLVAHAVEFFPQDASTPVELPNPFPDPLPAFPPLLQFFEGEQDAGRIHGGRFTPDGPDYLIVMSRPSFLFDLGAGDDVLEQVEEVHRLAHEIFRNAFARIESEDELQVVHLPDAD